MWPTVYRIRIPKTSLWWLSDPATIAAAVLVAVFLAYAVGYFNGFDSALAVSR